MRPWRRGTAAARNVEEGGLRDRQLRHPLHQPDEVDDRREGLVRKVRIDPPWSCTCAKVAGEVISSSGKHSRCGSNLVCVFKYVWVRKGNCAWIARVAGVGVRLAPQRTLLCSCAPGEPPGRRQWDSFPPAGTRGEVGTGVSEEPSSSPEKRICVEEAGEGRRVWRRSGKSPHQSKRAGFRSQSDEGLALRVTEVHRLHYLALGECQLP